MPRLGRVSVRRPALAVVVAVWALATGPSTLRGQSIVAGSLHGDVLAKDGGTLGGTQVTIENRTSGSLRVVVADRSGRFDLTLLPPGTYSVLAEQIGYQPLRQGGVRVVAGQTSSVRLVLERRPPPITNVAEIPLPEHEIPSNAPLTGQVLDEREVRGLDWRRDITDVSRSSSIVGGPRDGRTGFAEESGGLPGEYSRLLVDGLLEPMERHPRVPGEPATAPAFPRDAFDQARIIGNTWDTEYPIGAGSLLSASTRAGGNRFRFEPFATYSGKAIGTASRDNPADSSFGSLQAGATLSGAIVRDTAQFFLAGDYQTLKRPSAFPLEQDAGTFGGAPVSIRATIPAIAADSFGTATQDHVNPVVRSFRGGRLFSRFDWLASKSYSVSGRVSYAQWNEDSPQLGSDFFSGFDSRLEARDLSAAIAVTGTFGPASDELRVGLNTEKRNWSGSTLPATYLVAEDAAIGAAPALPGNFSTRSIEFANTFLITSGAHSVKVGLAVNLGKYTTDYLYGAGGIFHFGDLDNFGNGTGDFFRALVANPSVEFSKKDISLYLQDAISLGPRLTVTGGIRYDRERLPTGAVSIDSAFARVVGVVNSLVPQKIFRYTTRLGFVWIPGNGLGWTFRGGGGLFEGELSPALFSEAILNDGPVRIFRTQRTFASWPLMPDTLSGGGVVGSRLTLFAPSYREPRTSKLDLGASRPLSRGLTLHLNGAYHHTDYLPRRTNLNRLLGPTGLTQEGRPIYGILVRQGGLISSAPGSDNRFSGLDLVSGMEPTGFSDYYEATIELERLAVTGFSFSAAYTFSRTRDNWLTGGTGDPEDQLSPFPQDPISAEWVKGRSDFDVPHRAFVSGEYRFPGRLGFTIGARYRFRSGLPYTPGFQPGVDANGDGSGRNDPAFVNSALSGMSALISANGCLSGQDAQFVQRNSCRDPAVHSVDLRFAVGVPMASLHGQLEFTLDALNLVSTETGIYDHALVLIDPAQPLVTDPSGNVTLPLIANPRFGTLLSRRGENRVVRFGVRVGY